MQPLSSLPTRHLCGCVPILHSWEKEDYRTGCPGLLPHPKRWRDPAHSTFMPSGLLLLPVRMVDRGRARAAADTRPMGFPYRAADGAAAGAGRPPESPRAAEHGEPLRARARFVQSTRQMWTALPNYGPNHPGLAKTTQRWPHTLMVQPCPLHQHAISLVARAISRMQRLTRVAGRSEVIRAIRQQIRTDCTPTEWPESPRIASLHRLPMQGGVVHAANMDFLHPNGPNRLGWTHKRPRGARESLVVHAANVDCPQPAWPESPRIRAAQGGVRATLLFSRDGSLLAAAVCTAPSTPCATLSALIALFQCLSSQCHLSAPPPRPVPHSVLFYSALFQCLVFQCPLSVPQHALRPHSVPSFGASSSASERERELDRSADVECGWLATDQLLTTQGDRDRRIFHAANADFLQPNGPNHLT